ncbi:hypothetical protein ACRXCV_00465 (plasmid) [Halobacteriovorax sp. GFR7]|uniref:hypothetical protein n=1 Tax=unclassified Halobacteriovorax TaxID=2639665 RepID=UPI003D99BA9A
MAHNLTVAPFTEGEPLVYVDGINSAETEGSLHIVGSRLYHIREGDEFDYLDAGTSTWVTATYASIGLIGSFKFLYTIKISTGVLLVTDEGKFITITTSGVESLGTVGITRNVVQGQACEFDGFYYFAGVSLEVGVNGTVTRTAFYEVVDKSTLAVYFKDVLVTGLTLCYPSVSAWESGVGLTFNQFDPVTARYAPMAWSVNLNAVNAISLNQYYAHYPHKQLSVAGYLCWALDDTIYRWKLTLGLLVSYVAPSGTDYFQTVQSAGDYGLAQGFYTPSEVLYSTNAIDWTLAATQILPTAVTNMEAITFLKPEGLHVNNMESVVFLEPAGATVANMEAVMFVKAQTPVRTEVVTVVNGGAETGDTTGWTNTLGTLAVRSSSPTPHTGSYYFFGDATAAVEANQVIDLVAGGYITASEAATYDIRATVSWWQRSFNGEDQGGLGLKALDASDVVLATTNPIVIATSSGVWTHRTEVVIFPATTEKIEIDISMLRVGGSNLDAYIDDIELTLDLF